MKVRFRSPEKRDPHRDRGISFEMAPASRPRGLLWRWYLLVLLVALPAIWLVLRFAGELLSLKGSGYITYARFEVSAPVNGVVGEIRTGEGRLIGKGDGVVVLRPVAGSMPAGDIPGSTHGQAGAAEEAVTSAEDGRVERVWVRPGEAVAVGAPLLTVRTQDEPLLQAWMDVRHLDRLWPGRPATVQLPDGSARRARITHVRPSTELTPPGLISGAAGPRSRLVIGLRLEEPLTSKQMINQLPVEVRLHWRDEFFRK